MPVNFTKAPTTNACNYYEKTRPFLYIHIFFCPMLAQTYKYLGVEDGLSNRRVYAIQKGPKGYMWFLTHNGIDRYDGKNFKQYRLIDSEIEVNSMLNLSWLYVGTDGTLWEIGKKGRVFRYDAKHDRFQLVYKLPDEVVKGNPTPVSYGFIDSNNIVWLCNEEALYLYDTNSEKNTVIENHIGESITDIEQIDPEHYLPYRCWCTSRRVKRQRPQSFALSLAG